MPFPDSGPCAIPIPSMPQVPPRHAAALLAALQQIGDHDPDKLISAMVEPRPPLTLAAAYRICAEITREHSLSFFLSSQFLPNEKRHAIRALYALCRTTDDLVDRPASEASQALASWIGLVHAPRPPAHHPVLLAWNDTACRYAVDMTLVDELLAGVAMDLTVSRYAIFDDLWLYCYRVASVVGLISMQITGHEPGAAPYAIRLGVALQLTNILRDVGEDAALGRIYLPQEDMARFGLSDADILRRQRDDRFRALMRFEIARADALYEEAWPGVAQLHRDSQFAVGAAIEIYRAILRKIAANDYDVFSRRAYVTLAEKVLILTRVRRRLGRLGRGD